MAPRGRGGKFSKPTRGGGKHFSKNLTPLDKDGNALGMWRDPKEQEDESEEEEEDDSSAEESSEEESGPSQKPEMTREERRAAAKAKKERAIARKNQKVAAPGDLPSSEDESEDEDEDMPANPNHTAKSRSQASMVPTAAELEAAQAAPKKKPTNTANLSRREREALQAQQAKERYQKLHAEGKTDEARADLERLALVKERRETEAARKQAEKEEREERERDKVNDREAKLRNAAMGKQSDKKGEAASKTSKAKK